MPIAILTFDGYNELSSFVALGILHRIRQPDWRVTLCCPGAEVTSMNGSWACWTLSPPAPT